MILLLLLFLFLLFVTIFYTVLQPIVREEGNPESMLGEDMLQADQDRLRTEEERLQRLQKFKKLKG